MKTACILLLCMATIAFAYFEDDEEEYIVRRSGNVQEKVLAGGYIFKTTASGNGKYKCECFKGGKKVWAGMCGVRDKKFSYSDCE